MIGQSALAELYKSAAEELAIRGRILVGLVYCTLVICFVKISK